MASVLRARGKQVRAGTGAPGAEGRSAVDAGDERSGCDGGGQGTE